jgi:outer membrane protein W
MAGRVVSRGALAMTGIALLLAVAGDTRAGERNWRVRLSGAFAGTNDGVVTGPGASVVIGGGVGVGLNFEYRFAEKLGFEMGAIAIGGTVSVGASRDWWHDQSIVEVGSFLPVTFGFNYHPFKRSETFDLFFGPLIGPVFHSRVGVGGLVGVEARTDLGLGLKLSADINLGKSRWCLSPGITYIAIVADGGSGGSKIDFDPLILTFGFGFRF